MTSNIPSNDNYPKVVQSICSQPPVSKDSKGNTQEERTKKVTKKYRDFSQVNIKTLNDSNSWINQEITPKEPPFPVKLHQMLSNPDIQDIIFWLPHGRSWRILKQKAFEEKVIPQYFRHGRYASFARQVNGWGFRRITRGIDYNSYYHELFLRGMPHLCNKMRRLTAKDIRKRKKMDDVPVPNFYELDRENPLPHSSPTEAAVAPKSTEGIETVGSIHHGVAPTSSGEKGPDSQQDSKCNQVVSLSASVPQVNGMSNLISLLTASNDRADNAQKNSGIAQSDVGNLTHLLQSAQQPARVPSANLLTNLQEALLRAQNPSAAPQSLDPGLITSMTNVPAAGVAVNTTVNGVLGQRQNALDLAKLISTSNAQPVQQQMQQVNPSLLTPSGFGQQVLPSTLLTQQAMKESNEVATTASNGNNGVHNLLNSIISSSANAYNNTLLQPAGMQQLQQIISTPRSAAAYPNVTNVVQTQNAPIAAQQQLLHLLHQSQNLMSNAATAQQLQQQPAANQQHNQGTRLR